MGLPEELEKSGNWLFKYRSILPVIILIAGLIMHARTEYFPGSFILEGTVYEFYYESICFMVSLFGLAIRMYALGYVAKNTSGRNSSHQIAECVNKTGIYSTCRHPLYLGNFMMWLGPALLPGNIPFIVIFCLTFWLYYERIIFAEEQFLRKKFGDEYLKWSMKTPAFFPSFKHFNPTRSTFNWRKVIYQEKTGILALFAVFALFDFIGEMIEMHYQFNSWYI